MIETKMETVFGIKIPDFITYRIVKDTSGFYHITYDNNTVSFFHTLDDAKEKLRQIIRETNN